jgi:hypothetical protein
MGNWLDFPIVAAPAAHDRSAISRYEISRTFITKHADNRRCTPIFQLWAHVIGQLPPINNIGRVQQADPTPSLTTLADSVACFQGINRPHDREEDGCSVLVYVLNPSVSIKFLPDMVCLATALKVPRETVLTVQVRPDVKDLSGHSERESINGVITRLEFVWADPSQPTLPKKYSERYAKTLWRD